MIDSDTPTAGDEPASSMEFRLPIDLPHLNDLLERFTNTASPDEAKQMLEKHPDLLTSDFMWVLDMSIKHFSAERNVGAVFAMQQRRALLQRCVEVGVSAAIGEVSA